MSRRYFGSGTSVRDKTSAFRLALAAARGKSTPSALGGYAGPSPAPAPGPGGVRSARYALLDDALPPSASPSPHHQAGPGKQRGEFAQRAQLVFLDVARTSEKLGNLAQLVQRRTIFDDRAVEISQLTQVIKADLAAINSQISGLQQFAASSSRGGKGAKAAISEHQGNVVTLLQSSLAGATSNFQDILETRTQNMKASQDRTGQYTYTGNRPTPQTPEVSRSPLYRNRKPAAAAASTAYRPLPGYNVGPSTASGSSSTMYSTANSTALAEEGGGPHRRAPSTMDGEYLALDMGSNNAQSDQQMRLLEQQDNYVQQRSSAIESIEGTISELGQMFGQLAHMVAAQRETVQRIDADVFDISDNVSSAQNELLRFYASVSSNRGLMLKIFGVRKCRLGT